MLVKLYLHGHLKDKIKKDYVKVEANTLYDALHSLAFQYQKELQAPLDVGRWKIMIKDYETKESWFVPLYTTDIHIFPVFKTAKSKWVSVGIGIAIMAVAVLASGGTLGPAAAGIASAEIGAGVTVGSMAFGVGLSIALSGVVNLLTPTPKNDTYTSSTENNSKYLGAQGNTAGAGTRIPLGYGLFKVSGHFISFNVTSTKIVEV